jgi:hypothetical protein
MAASIRLLEVGCDAASRCAQEKLDVGCESDEGRASDLEPEQRASSVSVQKLDFREIETPRQTVPGDGVVEHGDVQTRDISRHPHDERRPVLGDVDANHFGR